MCPPDTDKKFILHSGYCPAHHRVSPGMVAEARAAHPGAPVLVHPNVSRRWFPGGFRGHTAHILDYAAKSDKAEFIIVPRAASSTVLKRRIRASVFIPMAAP